VFTDKKRGLITYLLPTALLIGGFWWIMTTLVVPAERHSMEEKARIYIESDLLAEYQSYDDVKTGFDPATRLFVYVEETPDGKILSFRPTKEEELNQWRIFLHRNFHYKITPDLKYEALD
jgi:hypothetical protein